MPEPKKQVIKYIPIDQIVINPRNERKHTSKQIQLITKSMEEFDFTVPLLVDKNFCLFAGHARLQAAKLRGLSVVPVICLEHLTPSQVAAYRIADNRLADLSVWNEPLLASSLKELSETVLDFDIEVTGFETPEIDALIHTLDEAEDRDASDTFELATPPFVSRLGDVWERGEHRLICGSALESRSYENVMKGDVASAAFTDPPYNVKIDGNVSGLGKNKHREFAMASGEMSFEEYTDFLATPLGLFARNAHPAALMYTCMDWRHGEELFRAGRQAGLDLINICVWVKTNGGMGSFYRSKHEFIFVYRNGRAQHRNNVQLGRFGRNRSNVWSYAGANCFGSIAGEKVVDLHPTVKPIALIADALLDSTGRGDIILDPFAGSGTSILAAERTKRKCRAIELDPIYVDTAIKRWERMTKATARHSSGMTFQELGAERGAIV